MYDHHHHNISNFFNAQMDVKGANRYMSIIIWRIHGLIQVVRGGQAEKEKEK